MLLMLIFWVPLSALPSESSIVLPGTLKRCFEHVGRLRTYIEALMSPSGL